MFSAHICHHTFFSLHFSTLKDFSPLRFAQSKQNDICVKIQDLFSGFDLRLV
jgi:hypothetical protein